MREAVPGAPGIGGSAYAVRLAERLIGPAQAILGYAELIVEEVREAGPAEALDDLDRVLTAARGLNALVGGLLNGEVAPPEGAEAEARLRHDLRTPMNAVLGYSEMVVEEFADALPARAAEDIETVRRESRALLGGIDAIVDFSRNEAEPADEADHTIAAQLAQTIAADPSRPASRPGRILIVDDQKTNRDLLARRLRREGHVVMTAASGRAALDLMQGQEPDLALIDILMPEINGIELLARMKAEPRLRDIPVLMISGLKEEDAVLRCIEAGAEDYLPKPVNPVLLRARISACLDRRRGHERERRYLESIEAEKARADALLHAILPVQVVRRLAGGEQVIADRFDAATIIFADIVDFTPLAAQTCPAALVQRLGRLFSRFDELADQYGIEKIKTIGDAYMAAAGLPEPRADHAAAAVAFARALIADMDLSDETHSPLRLRVGIHSGPVIAGLIGRKRFVYDVWGHTVNLASRLESHGAPGRIQISDTTLAELGAGTAVDAPGAVEMKGVGAVRTYLLPA